MRNRVAPLAMLLRIDSACDCATPRMNCGRVASAMAFIVALVVRYLAIEFGEVDMTRCTLTCLTVIVLTTAALAVCVGFAPRQTHADCDSAPDPDTTSCYGSSACGTCVAWVTGDSPPLCTGGYRLPTNTDYNEVRSGSMTDLGGTEFNCYEWAACVRGPSIVGGVCSAGTCLVPPGDPNPLVQCASCAKGTVYVATRFDHSFESCGG